MLIAEFHLSTPVLRDALAAAPEVTADLERTIEGETTRIEFFARGDDLTRFEDAIGDDESVADVRVLGEGPDFRFYRATLAAPATHRTTYHAFEQTGAHPVSASGDHTGWNFRVQFPDREALAGYRDSCRERNVSFTLHALYERADPRAEADEHGLAGDHGAV
ncbi:bacterio-opsin activator domain-containing protein [Halobaculum litoreum]|uniref:Bacterio-opsin activator domain-containing protein n=1 Tax=Halobaculum litoreum TaxID=3031998 RepID=A0ABD5XR58_9EURY|nr:bacterio-opsin activator domain-containing protein [Halobaculum sp. DT92]